MDHVNLNHLRVFHAVAQRKNFTRAAEQLFVSQPAVHAQARAFERWCGVPVFHRNGRHTELTEQGKVLWTLASRVFALVSELEATADAWRTKRPSRLVVSSGMIIGTYLLPTLLRHFRSLYPSIDLVLNLGHGEEVEQRLLAGQCDIGFLGKQQLAEGLQAEHFVDDKLVLIVPATHPLARRRKIGIQDLRGQPLIVPERGTHTRQLIEERIVNAIRVDGAAAGPMVEINNPEAVKRAVAAGIGVSLVSVHALSDRTFNGIRQIPLAEGPIRRPFWIAYPIGTTDRPPVSLFLDAIRSFRRPAGRRKRYKRGL